MRTAATTLSELLLSVWETGPNDVWMAGLATDVDTGLLRHWNGTEWDEALTGSVHTLWDVWAYDSSDVWTGGPGDGDVGFVAHGDGSNFDAVDYSGGSPRALWGSDADDVWIAPYRAPLQHWDGTHWNTTDVSFEAFGMNGTGSNDVWLVGLDGLIAHFDGQRWTTFPTGVSEGLAAVWALSPREAWAVGGGGTILGWDGATWRARPVSEGGP